MLRALVFSAGILAASPSLAQPMTFDDMWQVEVGSDMLCWSGNDAACVERDRISDEIEKAGYCYLSPLDFFFHRHAVYYIKGIQADCAAIEGEVLDPETVSSEAYDASVAAHDERIRNALCSSEKTDPIPNAKRYYQWISEAVCDQ
jgi:hypothetical protein